VQLLTVGASQSMLIKEIGGSSTLRDQYRTAFYVGGDRKSAAAMLDMPERDIDDGPLGKGVVLLRSKATAPARLVRVPLVSNASLYRLLNVAQSTDRANRTAFKPASNRLRIRRYGKRAKPERNRIEAGSRKRKRRASKRNSDQRSRAHSGTVQSRKKHRRHCARVVRQYHRHTLPKTTGGN
jgi:hypothetical protein